MSRCFAPGQAIDDGKAKPFSSLLFEAMSEWPIVRQQSFFIGETALDAETALSAGMESHVFDGGDLSRLVALRFAGAKARPRLVAAPDWRASVGPSQRAKGRRSGPTALGLCGADFFEQFIDKTRMSNATLSWLPESGPRLAAAPAAESEGVDLAHNLGGELEGGEIFLFSPAVTR